MNMLGSVPMIFARALFVLLRRSTFFLLFYRRGALSHVVAPRVVSRVACAVCGALCVPPRVRSSLHTLTYHLNVPQNATAPG